jgi:hypothetical protein
VDFAAFLGVDAPPPSLSPLPQGSVIRFDPGDTEHAFRNRRSLIVPAHAAHRSVWKFDAKLTM